MKSRMCENCIKYKTIYCPNSDKCLSKEDKPFYEDKYTILTKIEALDEALKDYIEELQTLKIQISAREELCNRLESNWNKLKDYIKETKLKEFEKSYGKRYGKTFTQAEIIACNMILAKMQELEQGNDSNE